MQKFDKELERLGLSRKEALVYLAAIQLGPSPVQKISQKAKVNRATTYVIIESLMEMGLMSKYDEEKKTFFVAEKPERLVDFFQAKEKDLHEKLGRIKEIVPQLDSLYNDLSDKPIVKYYEGVEGIMAVQSDFSDSLKEKDIIYTFLPHDEFEKSALKKRYGKFMKRRVGKGIKMKIIYSSKLGKIEDYELTGKKELKEYCCIDYNKYPFKGGMNIYGNKIFMIDYLGKLGGIVIENKTLAELLKNVFTMIWDSEESR